MSLDIINGPEFNVHASNFTDKWLSWPNTDDKSAIIRWKLMLILQFIHRRDDTKEDNYQQR